MYSWAQRSDTQVLDEPLYAHHLRVTGLHRPYREQVLQAQENDGAKVLASFAQPREKEVLFAKHMGKQKIMLDEDLLYRGQHVILVRDPYYVIKSFSEVVPPSLAETSFPALCEIFSTLRSLGRPPVVILADELAANPEGMLRAMCQELGLPFQEAMLSWEPGPKPFDGVWAPWWYGSTHRHTGFQPITQKRRELLSGDLRTLLDECRPFYALLKRHALRPLDLVGGVPRALSNGEVIGTKRRRDDVAGNYSMGATHSYKSDPRNDDILIGIRDSVSGTFDLIWRPEAKVSVYDSGFILGDGVWEGIRLHKGTLLFAQEHIERLFEGSKALAMDLGITKRELEQMVYDTCDGNGMEKASHVHIRLMVTRGLKATPYQNPNATIGKPTIVVVPEYKEVSASSKERGIRLFTCHVRRGAPDTQDPMLNTHSKHNCIAACIQANMVGADEALMLDPHGFVATCNSVNFFVVRRGELWAPTGKYQLHGITRENTMRLAREMGIPVFEKDFTLAEVYSADEAFVTGTFAGQIPVGDVDGRIIGNGGRGAMTLRLQQAYAALCDAEAEKGRFPRPYVQASIQQIQKMIARQAAPLPKKPDPAETVATPAPLLNAPALASPLPAALPAAASAGSPEPSMLASHSDAAMMQSQGSGAYRKSKSGRNIYFEHAKKSWEHDPEFFLPDGTSWVEVVEEGNIPHQKRGVVQCWLCKLHGKVNSFTTGYIKGKKDALKAHMTISDHKELVEKWATSRKRPIPILVDMDSGAAAAAASTASAGAAEVHSRASSDDTQDDEA